MPNQKGNFKTVGAVRTWDGGKSTKIYIDIDKDGNYPQIGEFEVFGDKIDLSKFKAGDLVDVSFNIKGAKREWKDKKTGDKKSGFFQSLDAWKIDRTGESNTPSSDGSDDSNDDLPF